MSNHRSAPGASAIWLSSAHSRRAADRNASSEPAGPSAASTFPPGKTRALGMNALFAERRTMKSSGASASPSRGRKTTTAAAGRGGASVGLEGGVSIAGAG